MTPRQLARQTRSALRKAGDPRVAKGQRMVFKPWEKIHMRGVKTPDVRRIERGLYNLVHKEWGYIEAVAFCELLMPDRYIETKSLALTLLARYHRKYEEELLTRANRWLARDLCDNWASTDQLSTQIISGVLDKFENLAATVESWTRSPNLWVRRASAVSFVKPARKGRHLERAYRIVTALLPETHDLMHKACGWLLREAGKTDANRLERYLLNHGPAIPRTTVRYAIENFPDARRRMVLQKTRVA